MAIIRNAMAVQKKHPVRNQTTAAISIAGRKTISKPTRTIMMTSMMIRTKANVSLRQDCLKLSGETV